MGDTRIYKFGRGAFEQITIDHTLAQREYRMGRITKEEIPTHKDRHVLTNALGLHRVVACDIQEFDYHGETLLVCSDGLYNNVSETELFTILKGNDNTSQKVNELVQLANTNGGSDNIAVVLWESK